MRLVHELIIIKRTNSDSQRGPPRRRQGEQLGHRARHDLLRRRLGEGGDLSVQLVGQGTVALDTTAVRVAVVLSIRRFVVA